jgi:hypothetical protein
MRQQKQLSTLLNIQIPLELEVHFAKLIHVTHLNVQTYCLCFGIEHVLIQMHFDFYDRFKDEALSLDQWFMIQAANPNATTETIEYLHVTHLNVQTYCLCFGIEHVLIQMHFDRLDEPSS